MRMNIACYDLSTAQGVHVHDVRDTRPRLLYSDASRIFPTDTSPAQQRVGVPTWNLAAVYVRGTVRLLGDDETVEALRRLVKQAEAGLAATSAGTEPGSWSMDAVGEAELEGMRRGIVAMEITITHIEAKEKMSQNRVEEDALAVLRRLEGLAAVGGAAGPAARTAELLASIHLPPYSKL